jgi:type II secretion system protein G
MLRSSKGFTLIELLIVVVIIGILAAIAIPKFANTKEKAYISAMKSDLRNLAAAEEAYFADFLQYTTATTAMDFNPSQGVTVVPSSSDLGKGWKSTAYHSGTNTLCELYYGSGESGTTATQEGVVACQ